LNNHFHSWRHINLPNILIISTLSTLSTLSTFEKSGAKAASGGGG